MDAVLARIKVTTIRERAWPVGSPIMLYNWTGRPYASPQRDVAPVEVRYVMPIRIDVDGRGEIVVRNAEGIVLPHPWIDEGFDSAEDFAQWFRPLVGSSSLLRFLIRFELIDSVNYETDVCKGQPLHQMEMEKS